MDYVITLEDIKGRIFKDNEGISNYIHVSIEEMDWLVEQAEKVELLKESNVQNAFTVEKKNIEIEDLKKERHELQTFKSHAEFLLNESQFERLEEETKKHLEIEPY